MGCLINHRGHAQSIISYISIYSTACKEEENCSYFGSRSVLILLQQRSSKLTIKIVILHCRRTEISHARHALCFLQFPFHATSFQKLSSLLVVPYYRTTVVILILLPLTTGENENDNDNNNDSIKQKETDLLREAAVPESLAINIPSTKGLYYLINIIPSTESLY